ncbi:A/G-specific adenine glycosylase [Sphingomonas rhizophila]|uniref:Adenine DNA glycosylase n=1 Tax=Sphingomonas rhizophila TaxID=2071607 RepID=A0A7G9S9N8_9SPHN|nr:A/G-specific adenine glycosylase [Sphingomonas rhizophila]QNN64563.1 A/G-specific adenine glycosylase [Sphingomonas rhizophila]
MPARPADKLLSHYDANARALPWRNPPGSPPMDPYRVWLSEVMLQQTTVATVKPRFRRFVERWPTVEALAAAPAEDVMQEWAGLGYYARARNLHACAKSVAATGGFPRTADGLRKLPGIGDYTAAAVASIAFGEGTAAVDTNVERVIARLHGIDRPVAEARPDIRRLAAAMWPRDRAGDFAQALMDLGATICRPKAPLCGECPLAADCVAFASGTPEAFPGPKAKAIRPHRHGEAWWIERDGAIWLVRRPEKGILGGMAALPGPEWATAAPTGRAIAIVSHGFTHFTLDLHVTHRAAPPDSEGWWQGLATISEAGLPTLYARAIEAALAAREARADAA